MNDFKGRHFGGEIVLWAVRWYCRYAVSYRDLESMMTERGVAVDHSRDVGVKLRFHGINYYDGQGFMTRKDLGVSSAKELDGASVCIQTGTTTELNLADYFHANGMKYEAVTIETNDEARQNSLAGRCDVYTTVASSTTEEKERRRELERWQKSRCKERPRRDQLDCQHDAAKISDALLWLILREDEQRRRRQQKQNAQLLRIEGAAEVGLSDDWAYNIIKSVGNYGESFERNIGVNTLIGLERGINALWTDGGLQYSPPFR